MTTIGALIRTMSPDLARDVLADALAREHGLMQSLAHAEVDLEELLLLNESVLLDAQSNGGLLEGLAGSFTELHGMLSVLRQEILDNVDSIHLQGCREVGDLLMEELDV